MTRDVEWYNSIKDDQIFLFKVQYEDLVCGLCQKKCKSKGGLKRHMTWKHKDAEESAESREEEDKQIPPDVLANITKDVIAQLIVNKIFSKSMRDELAGYTVSEISDQTEDFNQLQTAYKHLAKSGNLEKFYATYYSTVVLKATSYFTGLSRNCATLLATKIGDRLVSYSKEKIATSNAELNVSFTDREIASLQYIGGYVLHKLYSKHFLSAKSNNSVESQQAMSLLKAGREVDSGKGQSQQLTSALNRGGLWAVTKTAQTIFLKAEQYFRLSSSTPALSRIDIESIYYSWTSDIVRPKLLCSTN